MLKLWESMKPASTIRAWKQVKTVSNMGLSNHFPTITSI